MLSTSTPAGAFVIERAFSSISPLDLWDLKGGARTGFENKTQAVRLGSLVF